MIRATAITQDPAGPHLRPWFRAGLQQGAIAFVGPAIPLWVETLPVSSVEDRLVHVLAHETKASLEIPLEARSARMVILGTAIPPNTSWAAEIVRVLKPGGMVFGWERSESISTRSLISDLNEEGLIACHGLSGVPKQQQGLHALAVRPLSRDVQLLTPRERRMVEELTSKGSLSFRARGGSMRPVIPDGNWVRIEAVAPDRELSVGRMAFILQPDRCVLHPIKRKIQTGLGPAFLCGGLRVEHVDLPVFRDAILGVLAETWPHEASSSLK